MDKKAKKILVSSCLIFILLLAGFIFYPRLAGNGAPSVFETVAKVNGEPVAYGELQHYINAYRSTVFTYFKNKYAAEDNENFWTTAYGGEIPAEKIKKLALEACVRRKVQQILGREYGLVKDISYKKLLDDMKTENAARREKVRNRQVIYGPEQYDAQVYFDETLNDLTRDLKDKLKMELHFTDQDYNEYYVKNKEKYALGFSRKIKAIAASFPTDRERKEKTASVKAELTVIAKRIEAGTEFDSIYNELVENNDGLLVPFEKVYDYKTPRVQGILQPALNNEINRMDAGQTTGIIEDEKSIGMYWCVEKKPLGYSPIDEVKPDIWDALIDIRYEALVNERVDNAKIEIISNPMGKVKMR